MTWSWVFGLSLRDCAIESLRLAKFKQRDREADKLFKLVVRRRRLSIARSLRDNPKLSSVIQKDEAPSGGLKSQLRTGAPAATFAKYGNLKFVSPLNSKRQPSDCNASSAPAHVRRHSR